VKETGEKILGYKKRKKEHGSLEKLIERKQIKEPINSHDQRESKIPTERNTKAWKRK